MFIIMNTERCTLVANNISHYCHCLFTGEVIFNHNEPDLPPDFIFDCHNFEPNFDNLEVSVSRGQAVCVI